MEYETFYVTFMSINLCITFIIMLGACLCCRRKIPKNEFLGLEGMVKIKNPEENTEPLHQIETNSSSTSADIDLRRASNAPHRSLPDIPVIETLNDNGSELYATVADKVHEKPQGRSPTPSLKKQTSVSQHSSISQADDVSSPYARVKTPPHDYDKVLSTEHPYAQLNTPVQQISSTSNVENSENNQILRRDSNQSLLNVSESQQQQPQQHHHHQQQQQQQPEIAAASAIAGMVSASQELPYMTPPIVQQPHFSGDSQDSSKGYTSISVREPLANILAQTNRLPPSQARLLHRGDGNDSHYATVSDDSDEMYAAIDDPNNVYTSGSETYAQIQPANAQITVSVEINATNSSRAQEQIEQQHIYETSKPKTDTPIPPPVDSLRAQMHSRQASSSSNTSSVGILGSPKPEKRQANSPLPPTPKNSQFVSNSNLTSSSSIPSGRNSVASVIECQLPGPGPLSSSIQSKENISIEINDNSSNRKNFSPSKDIEGMYAKVIKKNKFPNISSQNSSPIMGKKLSIETNSPNMKEYVLNAIQVSPGKNSIKSTSYLDNSYETIDRRIHDINFDINKPTELFVPNMLKSNILSLSSSSEPGYESLPGQSQNPTDPSDYDPNYEVLRPSIATYSGSSDDGYAKVTSKNNDDDMIDGYCRVKGEKDDDDSSVPGYSKISENHINKKTIENHDYASIYQKNIQNQQRSKNDDDDNDKLNFNNNDEIGSDIYSSIPNEVNKFINLDISEEFHNYQTICDIKTPSLSTEKVTATIGISTTAMTTSSSEKLTTPPTGIATTTTTPSPSTGPSNHYRYFSNNMKYSSTSNTLSSTTSNYESLTGSESDPNYESVRYLNSNDENPYERLKNSDSNISPDILQQQLVSPSFEITPILKNSINTSNEIDKITTTASVITQQKNSKNPINHGENGEVGDYFQV